jgi:hypothetical protein
MIYTRYLYDKKCVEFSLFVSLLNKNKEETLFWGLELFHSGFKDELIALIWRYYYELYAPFYINLENYILKYTKVWMKNRLDDTPIVTMLNNLCERDACVDFYIMYKNGIAPPKCLSDAFDNIDRTNDINEIYNIAKNTVIKLKLFKTRGKNALNNINLVFETVHLLTIKLYKSAIKSRLITGQLFLDNDNNYDPKFYIVPKGYDTSKYKTKPIVNLKGWKIPLRECIHTLQLKPTALEKTISDYDNWLYNASNTPIWKKRIARYKGTIDTVNQTVCFENSENEEGFYNMYNYEPDEQSRQTQNKWFGTRKYETWDHIYEKHKCEPYNEWLNENNY